MATFEIIFLISIKFSSNCEHHSWLFCANWQSFNLLLQNWTFWERKYYWNLMLSEFISFLFFLIFFSDHLKEKSSNEVENCEVSYKKQQNGAKWKSSNEFENLCTWSSLLTTKEFLSARFKTEGRNWSLFCFKSQGV